MLAAMCKNFLIMVVVLSGFFHAAELEARGSTDKMLPNTAVNSNSVSTQKSDSFDPRLLWQRIKDLNLDDLGLLDRVVTTIVTALGIPLKEPPPLDGKRVSRLDDKSRTSWYKSLTPTQRTGFNYFNESNQYFDENPEKALELVEKCLGLFPEFHDAIKDREILRYELKKPGAQEPDSFRKRRLAKQLVSDSIGISFLDSPQALSLTKKAIELDPSLREAYIERDLLSSLIENGYVSVGLRTEEVAERYFAQARDIQERDPMKAMAFIRATLAIKSSHKEALELLDELKKFQATKRFDEAKKVIETDFDGGFKILSEAIKLTPEDEDLKNYMSDLVKEMFRRGVRKTEKDPELAIAMLKQSVKYSRSRNVKYENFLSSILQDLVQKKLRNIANLFAERDPDELKIIAIFNEIETIDANHKEFTERKLEFAEKLQSYTKYYFTDDHRRALKIIIKVLELDPAMSEGIEDSKKLLKIESEYLVTQAEKIINSSEKNFHGDNFTVLEGKLWTLLNEDKQLNQFRNSSNFIDQFFKDTRNLVDKIVDDNPKAAYKLLELFNLRYPDHVQSQVEMNKYLDKVASQYHQEAVEFYGENNNLALELLLYGLDYNSKNPEILRDIDYLKSDMGL